MVRNGTGPTRIKHTDLDFLKSHKFAGVAPTFVDEFFADAGLTMPNQMIQDTEFTPPTPPLPYGCTDFSQADLATDLTKSIHNPNDLEAVTGANAKEGLDIRESLDACRPASIFAPHRLGWIQQYFNCRANGQLDYFDVFRLAQVVGLSVGEKRSISWGTPWFPSWENAIQNGVTIMPMPTDDEILTARRNPRQLPWHDSKLDGWTTKQGVLVYRNKSWQGPNIGDKGFISFTRDVINVVMTIPGTVAFTASINMVQNPARIDVTTLQWIVSFIQVVLKKYIS